MVGGIVMKTIEERAIQASEGYDDQAYSAGLYMGYKEGAKEQKAIDEEVRLKKCDDMTEAEYNRETAFVDWYLEKGKGMPAYSDAIEWARKEVISKACELLKAVGVLTDDDSIMGFIKAMEE